MKYVRVLAGTRRLGSPLGCLRSLRPGRFPVVAYAGFGSNPWVAYAGFGSNPWVAYAGFGSNPWVAYAGFGSLGSPSTRSPTMLRWICDVPPQIVSEREKKNDDSRAEAGYFSLVRRAP